MPNWVYNTITISGEAEAIARFREQAGKPHPSDWNEAEGKLEYDQQPISFWNFIAPPAEVVESGEYFGTHGYTKEGGKVGHTPNNWYEFQCDKWGTKWDACEANLDEESPTHLGYRFDTAWSPPSPVFEAMVEQFPELEFSIWWEEEQGFGEELETTTTEEGKALVVTRSWDIPDSHADYEAKDDLDSCRCSWESDPHDWYEDCEGRDEEIAKLHSEPDPDCDCELEEKDLVY